MSKQALVVNLDPAIARRIRAYLNDNRHVYASVSELFEVAVLNQLELQGGHKDPFQIQTTTAIADGAAAQHSGDVARAPTATGDFREPLRRPPPTSVLPLAEAGSTAFVVLSPWTNRLSPLKIALRALANLSLEGSWPSIHRFRQEAAMNARRLGFSLLAGQPINKKLAIGYPVGEDAKKSLARFIASFTVGMRENALDGPLAALGFVGISDNKIALTRDGWRLAAAPSPLLGEADGETLSDVEALILREAVRSAPSELHSVQEFLEVVAKAEGKQSLVDSALGLLRPQWSRDMVIAHRAALVGRLTELRLIEPTGRGESAVISLRPEAVVFREAQIGPAPKRA